MMKSYRNYVIYGFSGMFLLVCIFWIYPKNIILFKIKNNSHTIFIFQYTHILFLFFNTHIYPTSPYDDDTWDNIDMFYHCVSRNLRRNYSQLYGLLYSVIPSNYRRKYAHISS